MATNDFPARICALAMCLWDSSHQRGTFFSILWSWARLEVCFGQRKMRNETGSTIYEVLVHLGSLPPREPTQGVCGMTRPTSQSCSTGHWASRYSSRRHLIGSSRPWPRSAGPGPGVQNRWPETNIDGCYWSHYILDDLLQHQQTADGNILCKCKTT